MLILAEANKCMLMLKRYVKLLFPLFSDMCPFFKELLEIIQALEEYLRNAHKQMIVPTKESIMWIVLLQS